MMLQQHTTIARTANALAAITHLCWNSMDTDTIILQVLTHVHALDDETSNCVMWGNVTLLTFASNNIEE